MKAKVNTPSDPAFVGVHLCGALLPMKFRIRQIAPAPPPKKISLTLRHTVSQSLSSAKCRALEQADRAGIAGVAAPARAPGHEAFLHLSAET